VMNSATERRPRIYSRTSHRLREVERIIAFRHAAERPLSRAGCIPDTDDADVYLDQAACCLLVLMWKKTGTKPDLAALGIDARWQLAQVARLAVFLQRWARDLCHGLDPAGQAPLGHPFLLLRQ
jgi:hypothetical protein